MCPVVCVSVCLSVCLVAFPPPPLQLLSDLPSVSDTLGLRGGCGLEGLVPAAVSLTVPRAITRTMLNQGIQVG